MSVADVTYSDKGPSSFFKAFRDAGPFFGIGIQMAVTVVIMFFVGRWLDQEFGTSPWLMLVFTFFGIVIGIYQFFQTVLRIGRKENKEKNRT